MDISSEKRIADATAQEIAELESLKDKGFVMVPKEQFERLVRESFSYRFIVTTYQRCTADDVFVDRLAEISDTMMELNDDTTMTIQKEMAELMEKRKEKSDGHTHRRKG